jgi:hypothetical protein
MVTMIRLVVLLAASVLGLWADSVETFTSAPGEESCAPCGPLYFDVPQFNPSLGVLNSIDWSLAGGVSVDIDIDYCTTNPPGPLFNYSYDITVGYNVLGTTVSDTQTGSGAAHGGCYTSGEIFAFQAGLQTSGSIPDPSSFIGNGTMNIPATPSISGDVNVDTPLGAVFFGLYGGTMSVTYDYTAAPEPRTTWLMLVGCGLVAVLQRNARSRRNLRA